MLVSFGRLPTSSGVSKPTARSSAANILTTDWTTVLKDYTKQQKTKSYNLSKVNKKQYKFN